MQIVRLRALLLASLSLAACDKSKPTELTAPTTSASTTSVIATAAASTAAIPERFTRTYKGTVGGSDAVMRLTKEGDKLTGSYAYTKIGRGIALTGTATPNALSLNESTMGQTTGTFTGSFGPDGAFAGTWATPSGDRRVPFEFKEGAADVPGAAVAEAKETDGKVSVGKRVGALSGDQAAAFLVKYAHARGKTLSLADAKNYFEKTDSKLPFPLPPFNETSSCVTCDQTSIYSADVNNDGHLDYVVTTRNSVGMHNDTVIGVYTFEGAKVQETPFIEGPLERAAYNLEGLAQDSDGTSLLISIGTKLGKYQWKGGTMKKLGNVDRASLSAK